MYMNSMQLLQVNSARHLLNIKALSIYAISFWSFTWSFTSPVFFALIYEKFSSNMDSNMFVKVQCTYIDL
jgi:hypothetical protein